jgi:NitT/TauT family transport system ATP-binding protein
MATIQFKDVSRVFKRDGKDFLILDNIQLMVQDQEFVAIVGPSGCGKTTCMRMAAGLEFPSTGTVQVNDVVVTEPGPDRAVVFQQFALFPWKTVHDNIDFGLRSKGIEKDERERLIAHYIALMNLKGYENAYPHQ